MLKAEMEHTTSSRALLAGSTAASVTGATADNLDWAVGDIEPVIKKLRNTIGIFSHLAGSDFEVTTDEWYQIEDDLTASVGQVEALWQKAWDQRLADQRAHAATIEAVRAEKAAPGSKADAAEVAVSWELLAAATNVAAKNCIEAGYPLVPFGPKPEKAAPKRSRKRIQRPQSGRKRAG